MELQVWVGHNYTASNLKFAQHVGEHFIEDLSKCKKAKMHVDECHGVALNLHSLHLALQILTTRK